MVEAVFVMDERTEHLNWRRTGEHDRSMWTLKFQPVKEGSGRSDEERERFKQLWDATPSGSIQLSTINPDAAGFFKPGMPYRVTFEEIPEPTE